MEVNLTGRRGSAAGFSMIEVLIAMVVLAIGLLGIAALQTRLHSAELEAYQRAQAVMLLGDMVKRMEANNHNAASYVSSSAVGAGMTCPQASGTAQQIDKAQWCIALQGAAEIQSGQNAGAMIGGRGCVQAVDANTYMITVAWQGVVPIAAPPASVTCGANQYDGVASTGCINDLCRRFVTSIVRVAAL